MANGPVNVAGTLTADAVNVIDVPHAAGALVYTGVKQSPAWINYDTSKMEISGQICGIEAGSYTANFTPKANYIWREDGSQQTKSAVWVINKPKPQSQWRLRRIYSPRMGCKVGRCGGDGQACLWDSYIDYKLNYY